MNTKRSFLILLLAASLFGCVRQHDSPEHLVVLIDISGSIEPSAEEDAFKALDSLIGRMHRGDKIAVIPITGDAQTQASGRIIRFELLRKRQAYDNDLRKFRVNLKISLEQLKSAATAHPGAKTDILGSIGLAEQEFQSESGNSKRVLAILSDFIQENRELDFRRDKHLASRATAKEFAVQTAKPSPSDFREVLVYLGLLRSTEYAGIGRSRRESIQEFWIEYFKSSGAQTRFMTDGPGLLEEESREK